jgi:hypothetical protein
MQAINRQILLTGCILLLSLQAAFAERILHYPRVRQQLDQWCWVGCSQWILGFHGIELSQEQIARYGWVDGQERNSWNWIYTASESGALNNDANAYGRGLNIILPHFGVPVTYKPKTSSCNYILDETEFEKDIDAGHPFVVRWAWTDGGGHFTVAMGYANGMCYLMNPWENDGIQVFDYAWVRSGKTSTSSQHTWDYTLQTNRVDNLPTLTCTFPPVATLGEEYTVALTASSGGADVSPGVWYEPLTANMTIDTATKLLRWIPQDAGDGAIRFIMAYGSALDTITKKVAVQSRTPVISSTANSVRTFSLSADQTPSSLDISVFIPDGESKAASLSLFALNGKLVQRWEIPHQGHYRRTLDKSSLSQSIYLLVAQSRSERLQQRIFVR